MKSIIALIAATLLLVSCEKIVTLKYKTNEPAIIVEGNITNEAGPYFVSVTRSISLTETTENPAVDIAIVTISDDAGTNETLQSTGNGMYQTIALAGVAGRTYTLTVKVDGQVYTAQSTMPAKVALDSVKIEEIAGVGGDNEYNLIPIYNDPAATGNNYRFVLWVNDTLINQHFVQSDEVKNGGVNTLKLEVNNDDLKLKAGDVVEMAMQCIDKETALYYTTMVQITNSGPGGGTTPTNPPNNISNGALGLFSAHTVQARKQIVQ